MHKRFFFENNCQPLLITNAKWGELTLKKVYLQKRIQKRLFSNQKNYPLRLKTIGVTYHWLLCVFFENQGNSQVTSFVFCKEKRSAIMPFEVLFAEFFFQKVQVNKSCLLEKIKQWAIIIGKWKTNENRSLFELNKSFWM